MPLRPRCSSSSLSPFRPNRWHDRSVTVDGVAVEAIEGGSPRGKAAGTLQVRVGNHDCCVGYRAAPRPGRYYYRFVGIVTPRYFFMCSFSVYSLLRAPLPICLRKKDAFLLFPALGVRQLVGGRFAKFLFVPFWLVADSYLSCVVLFRLHEIVGS